MKSSREASYTFGDNYESKRFGQKNVPEVQYHQAQILGPRYLL